MVMDDLHALVMQRRSIRGYDENRDIPDEVVRTILDCARWAPSGGNGQPWEFVVVRDQATRYKIADYYMKQMEQKREMDLAVRGTARMTGDGFRRAPVHIVILGDPRVKVTGTCVRVPVPRAHSAAIHLELERKMTADEARAILAAAPGVRVVDEPERNRFPTPRDAAGGDSVLVGRVREDLAFPTGLALFGSMDQLRKGAALNAVQIAEELIRRSLV